MKVTGSCHCGQITYEAEVDPETVRVCHCTDCQKLTGRVSCGHFEPVRDVQAEERDTEDLRQDGREWEPTRPCLLPGLRHTGLFHLSRATSLGLWTAGRRARPANTIRTTGPADLVPLGVELVDGFARHGTVERVKSEETRWPVHRNIPDVARMVVAIDPAVSNTAHTHSGHFGPRMISR